MNITLPIAVFSLTFILLITTLVHLRRLMKILKRARIERSLYFNRSSEFILILEESLKVLKVSQSILRRFNLQSENLLGEQIENTPLWPNNIHDQSESLRTFRKVLSGKQGEPSVFTYNRRDKENRALSMQISVISIPAVSGRKQDIVCLARDNTAEIGTKQKLGKRVLVENLIEEISASALTASSLKECVPGILKSAAELLEAKGAFFIHTDSNNNILWNSVDGLWKDLTGTSLRD